MLKLIRKLFPQSTVTVLSLTPEIDGRYYSIYNARVKSRLFNTYGYSTAKKLLALPFYLLRVLLCVFTIKLGNIKLGSEQDTLEEYLAADIVISCGGGFLGGNKYSSMLINLFPLYYSKLLGKKVVIFAQSVEPFTSSIVASLTKLVLDKVDLIFVRETDSLELLRRYQIQAPIALTADASFLVDAAPRESALAILKSIGVQKRPFIGITVRRWHFPGHRNHKTLFKNYLNSVAKTVEHWVGTRSGTVIVFPQVALEKVDDDRDVSFMLFGLLSKNARRNTVILTEDLTPEELKSLVAIMDLFIGTRMHSNIFALSSGVPTVAIQYEMKTHGVMKQLGLEKYLTKISRISAETLITLSEEAFRQKVAIHERLAIAVPPLRRMVFRSMALATTQNDKLTSDIQISDNL